MLENGMERVWLQIKGMRSMFIVPLIGYFCLIPICTWLLSRNSDAVVEDVAAQLCYLVMPILATWWTFMVQKEYIEGDGREVLLLGRGIFFSAVSFWLLNILCYLALLLLIDADLRPKFTGLMIQMIIISFLMTGLAYFLNFMIKSITISMFLVVFYTAFSNYTFLNDRILHLLGHFQLKVLQEVVYEEGWGGYIKYIVAGASFWALGAYKSKKAE